MECIKSDRWNYCRNGTEIEKKKREKKEGEKRRKRLNSRDH